MSPEQARGESVDKRTDIWAFGCVFFEMLTGRAAFGGDTFSDTLVAILQGEPEWTALPPIPGALSACCSTAWRRIRGVDFGTSAMRDSSSTTRTAA